MLFSNYLKLLQNNVSVSAHALIHPNKKWETSVRDVFNLFAQLGKNCIIDYKVAFFLWRIIKLNRLENLAIDFIHERPPPIRSILFESIERILSGFRPMSPMFFAKTVNRFYFQ